VRKGVAARWRKNCDVLGARTMTLDAETATPYTRAREPAQVGKELRVDEMDKPLGREVAVRPGAPAVGAVYDARVAAPPRRQLGLDLEAVLDGLEHFEEEHPCIRGCPSCRRRAA